MGTLSLLAEAPTLLEALPPFLSPERLLERPLPRPRPPPLPRPRPPPPRPPRFGVEEFVFEDMARGNTLQAKSTGLH